jgi:hypothetical protein
MEGRAWRLGGVLGKLAETLQDSGKMLQAHLCNALEAAAEDVCEVLPVTSA